MSTSEDLETRKKIAVSALFVLFFIQLLTTWFESMYRMGVIKTSMGKEIYGMLLIFVPLILFMFPKSMERWVLRLAFAGVLLTRVLIPVLGVRANILVGGVGIACCLIVVAFALSRAYAFLRVHAATGLGLGLLLSVVLRAWGSSYDITLGGPNVLLGWFLTGVCGALLLSLKLEEEGAPARFATPIWAGILTPVGVFANMALLYWVLSSPAVVSAWAGTTYLVDTLLLLIVWCIALWQLPRLQAISRPILILWNLGFVLVLVGGILWHTPEFPKNMGDGPTIFFAPGIAQQMPFYFMLVLSPVVLANMIRLLGQDSWQRPKVVVFPVVLGFLLLFILTMLGVFSNTWGYMGALSAPFRGGFYIHQLLNGMLLILPVLFLSKGPVDQQPPAIILGTLSKTALVLVIVALCGVVVKSWRSPVEMPDKQLTILTYNLQVGSEEEGDQNYHDQLAFLRKVDADIVGLQESDTARPGPGNIDVARFFGDGLGYHIYYGPSVISGTFGTAILSRYPLKNPRSIFSYSTKDEAGTAAAEIEVGGVSIGIFNSHPAGSQEAKLAHIEDLIAQTVSYEHVIAVGDYNSRPSMVPYGLIDDVLINSWADRYTNGIGELHPTIGRSSIPGDGLIDMSIRIDHIFLTPNFTTLESYYVPSPESETDHPAHWSVVTWE